MWQQEEDLFQMMAGAVQVLTAANCALVGGHTAEAAELSLGFAVNGGVKEEDMLRKVTSAARCNPRGAFCHF